MPEKRQISDETRERQRQAAIARWQSPEYRAKWLASRLALEADPDFKAKKTAAIRAALEAPAVQARRYAATQDPERRAKIGAAHRGRKDSPEVRARKSQARIGMKFSPEHCAHIREIVTNRSPETIEKIRQARLKQKIPMQDTRIECLLRDAFTSRGLVFEQHKPMFGRFLPDFVFEDARLIVQADGDYWHLETERKGSGKMAEKDKRFNAAASAAGWTVYRFTGTMIEQSTDLCAQIVETYLRNH